jgi:IMP dehydrogenase
MKKPGEDKMKMKLSFDDVLLVPQYSDIQSRTQEVDVSVQLDKNITARIPIISSPMDTVTESPMAAAMDAHGGIGIIHRYNTIDTQCRHVESMPADAIVGAAIGVSGDYVDRAKSLVLSGADILCVDIAHGHHVLMKHALRKLRNTLGVSVHIMAGNVATLEAVNDLADWGADSIRIGIGGGSICSTRIQTGHGQPTLSSIIDCASTDRDVTLIADGGIRNSGDICKAIAAGADFVMLGSMLSGTDESPGEKLFDQSTKHFYKKYRGMASIEAQIDWRGHAASVEGISSTVPYKGAVNLVIDNVVRGIRSGLSYSGARTITEFQSHVKMVQITSSGMAESKTHILNT